VIIGVRPEKLHLHRAGAPSPAGRNNVSGVITDASFFGVSTQYLVATPWGQELIAFEQNMSAGDRPRVGETVEMSWEPSHSFGFDGGANANAGIEGELLEVGHYTAADVEAGVAPTPALGG
jgi:spermidine/putrescine transport system ATP-binding protein